MLQNRRPFRLFLTGLAAVAVVVATSTAQPSTDVWWTRIRQRPRQLALLRVAADQQVQRQPLQVAWTYPLRRHRQRSHRRPRRHLRARPERIARRRRREDRQGALGPREHERHDQPRHQLLGKRRRPRPAADLRDEQPAAGSGREDRQVHHVVRHQRRRRSARRHRRPRSGDASATSSRTRPARSSRTSDHLGSATGEGYMSPPGDIRAYDVLTGKLVWTFHTVPRPGRVRLRHVAEGRVEVHRRHQQLGRDDDRHARAASPTSRSARRPTTSTAPTASARTSSARRSSRSTRAPASVCGTSSSCITTCGTWTRARRRS